MATFLFGGGRVTELHDSVKALLELEMSMRAFYDGAKTKTQIERLVSDLTHIRDQEVNHVILAKKMLSIVEEANA